MNAPTPLEDRIRRGLRDAAAEIPPADPQRHRPQSRPPVVATRPWTFRLAAGAVAAAAVTAAVVFVVRGDDEPSGEAEVGAPEQTTTSEQQVPESPPQDVVPGQAVLVDTELRTYDAAGVQTGTVNLAPLTDVQGLSSDLHGGWVACGTNGQVAPAAPSGEGEVEVTSPLVWFPFGREPVGLEATIGPFCVADSVFVVDGPEGPTVIYGAMPIGVDTSLSFSLGALVLETGENREVPIPAQAVPATGIYRGSASGNLVALHSSETGLILFDWTTGEVRPTPPIDLAGDVSDIALSADGTSIAAISGDASGPSDLVVYDLATGAERFGETFPDLPTEGAQLAYDGTVVAIGSYYDNATNLPVTVIDLASGARYTVDVHGLLP